MTEPSTLIGRTIRALGAKHVQKLWGYTLGYIYALARDPSDPDHPDNTGTERDPLTRIEMLLEKLATYPRHRWLLKEWKLHFDALFDRLLDRDDPDDSTNAAIIAHTASSMKEGGEAAAAAVSAAQASGCWTEAVDQVMEHAAHADRLARAVMRRAEQEGVRPLTRRSA